MPVLGEDRWIEVSDNGLSKVSGAGIGSAIGTFAKTPYGDWAIPVLASIVVGTGTYYLGKDIKAKTYKR
jgi:hypothetical protein